MAEHDEQAAVINWAQFLIGQYPELGLLFAIPNGAKLPYFESRSRSGKKYRWSPEAEKLKAEGLKPGVPDLFLPVARKGYNGLFIELKYGRNKPSEQQVAYLDALSAQGYLAVVCWGAEDAIETITEYLGAL
jgi:hypothetical protein